MATLRHIPNTRIQPPPTRFPPPHLSLKHNTKHTPLEHSPSPNKCDQIDDKPKHLRHTPLLTFVCFCLSCTTTNLPPPHSNPQHRNVCSCHVMLATMGNWKLAHLQRTRHTPMQATSQLSTSSSATANSQLKSDRWEFPRHRLKFFNVLGQGAFGLVWRCEATDIDGKFFGGGHAPLC